MNILEEIVAFKRQEVEERKKSISIASLEQSQQFSKPKNSLVDSIKDNSLSGIIAEFKRKSPSKGIINDQVAVHDVIEGYHKADVSGFSILTDHKYFGGSMEDLKTGRSHTDRPILRKEFIIDEFQIVEAKSIGANVILLIAACLSPQEIKSFTGFAHSINLEVLLEVHNREELDDNLESGADLFGVNNRNLKTFEVSIETSKSLAKYIPDNVIKVSESGISDPRVISELKEFGYKGFLIGENFMKTDNPGGSCEKFINELRSIGQVSR